MTQSKTLQQALDDAERDRWRGKRSAACLVSQAKVAMRAVAIEMNEDAGVSYACSDLLVSAVGTLDLRRAVAKWYQEGISPATITKRLNCLSVMGVNVEGCRPAKTRSLKWWLKPEMEQEACLWLCGCGYGIVADFISWTTRTGLRIEESLRLTRSDFNYEFTEVTVPGLKTSTSQVTLPLGLEATDIINRVYSGKGYFDSTRNLRVIGPMVPAFGYLENGRPLTYERLCGVWQDVRQEFGWQDDPTATLKALRRSAARYLHIQKGMPLDMVRQYLRHEDIETTMGYLRLTGGYGTEEMRRWL